MECGSRPGGVGSYVFSGQVALDSERFIAPFRLLIHSEGHQIEVRHQMFMVWRGDY